jgi:hypothetical protein
MVLQVKAAPDAIIQEPSAPAQFSAAAWREHARRVGEWLSLVEHLVRDQGVGGSNPLSPTIFKSNPAFKRHNIATPEGFLEPLACEKRRYSYSRRQRLRLGIAVIVIRNFLDLQAQRNCYIVDEKISGRRKSLLNKTHFSEFASPTFPEREKK